MKAILIDAINRTVTEVEAKGLRDYYKQLDCNMIQSATYLENGDVIYVDEEGLYSGKSDWFDIGAHQPFIGNGIVVGTGEEGDTTPAKSSVEEIQAKVRFMNSAQVRRGL